MLSLDYSCYIKYIYFALLRVLHSYYINNVP
jgi:hypothetical protein